VKLLTVIAYLQCLLSLSQRKLKNDGEVIKGNNNEQPCVNEGKRINVCFHCRIIKEHTFSVKAEDLIAQESHTN